MMSSDDVPESYLFEDASCPEFIFPSSSLNWSKQRPAIWNTNTWLTDFMRETIRNSKLPSSVFEKNTGGNLA